MRIVTVKWDLVSLYRLFSSPLGNNTSTSSKRRIKCQTYLSGFLLQDYEAEVSEFECQVCFSTVHIASGVYCVNLYEDQFIHDFDGITRCELSFCRVEEKEMLFSWQSPCLWWLSSWNGEGCSGRWRNCKWRCWPKMCWAKLSGSYPLWLDCSDNMNAVLHGSPFLCIPQRER